VVLDASQITRLIGLNSNLANRYLSAIRKGILKFCETLFTFSGEVEVDESFFGIRGIKDKRGHSISGKTIVFGILNFNGTVYREIVVDFSIATMQAVIQSKITLDSVAYSNGWRNYNGLVDIGYGKYLRMDHERN